MREVERTEETPFSRKNWSAAADRWRALLSTALSCEDWRTFWNAGMAIAARRPMMTTTIMISTSVKPLVERVFILYWVMCLLKRVKCRQKDSRFIYPYCH